MYFEISDLNLPDYIYVSVDQIVRPIQLELIMNTILGNTNWQDGTGIIFDYSAINVNFFSVSDIDAYNRTVFRHRNRLKNSLCAIIINENVDITVLNILEPLTDRKSNHRIRIFYRADDAKQWILSRRTIANSSQ